jgi:hypothetical protein
MERKEKEIAVGKKFRALSMKHFTSPLCQTCMPKAGYIEKTVREKTRETSQTRETALIWKRLDVQARRKAATSHSQYLHPLPPKTEPTTMKTQQKDGPSHDATMHSMQVMSSRRHSNKESVNHVVQIVLLMLIPLVFVLVWIALIYDKLLRNPFLAILLVLGVLVILFGGKIRFGPMEIQKAVVKNQS